MYNIGGMICSNHRKNRRKEKILDEDLSETGGFSGKIQEDHSNKQIEYVYKKCGKKFVIIGSGSVFSAEDAYEKIKLGSSITNDY